MFSTRVKSVCYSTVYKKQSKKKCLEVSFLAWHKQLGSSVWPIVNLFKFRFVLPVLNLVSKFLDFVGPIAKCLHFSGFMSIFNCDLKSQRFIACVEEGRLFHNLDI